MMSFLCVQVELQLMPGLHIAIASPLNNFFLPHRHRNFSPMLDKERSAGELLNPRNNRNYSGMMLVIGLAALVAYI